MAASANSSDDEISGINVTPFVDIALVLLIIFMVTAKYIVSQSIPVDLPQAATGQTSEETMTASVSVDRNGQFFVDRQEMTDAQLLATMRERFAANNDVRAVINADRTVPHGRVTEAIDLVRQAGITRFAIQTQQPATTP